MKRALRWLLGLFLAFRAVRGDETPVPPRRQRIVAHSPGDPRGELIAGPEKLEFEVLDADPRRLKKLRIHRRPTAEAAAELANPEALPAPGPAPIQEHPESRPGSAAAE